MVDFSVSSSTVSRWLVRLLLGLAISMVVSLALVKTAVEHIAQRDAHTWLTQVEFSLDQLDLGTERLTTLVHKAFIKSAGHNARIPLLVRARPYLTHRFIPAALRIQAGAIDTIFMSGHCDNASRTLAYILRASGLLSQQLNVVSPSSAHSVVLAETLDGRRLYLDPEKAVVPKADNRILSPEEARDAVRNGLELDHIWQQLVTSASLDFYANFHFSDAIFAVQGQTLNIEADVFLTEGESVTLGESNGLPGDVSHAAAKAQLTPYWDYIGSRYDRSWVRSLRFHQNTRVVIALTAPPLQKFITSRRLPIIRGHELIYEIDAGEVLSFQDGAAGYDWLRLRSYQDIDYIQFEMITKTPNRRVNH